MEIGGTCLDQVRQGLYKALHILNTGTKSINILTVSLFSFSLFFFAVPPFVTVHPQSKIRMPGQSVTFCCDGQGNPPPEIEW